MDALLAELLAGFPESGAQWLRYVLRLFAAALCGAVIGMQREQAGKPAGLRTHMLVATGTALFVLASGESGMAAEDVSRVIQGVATGIGFLGAGAILKLDRAREITGLTTAAGIWITAAVGVAVGLGRLGIALLATVLAWVILAVIGWLEVRYARRAR